jgi:hypothetical protein
VVIRTPDQRLRVFVSSTVGERGELAEERRAVERAISALVLAAGSRLTQRQAVALVHHRPDASVTPP